MPDVVVFSSAPMRVLSDLASTGLRQLAALLPIIEQAVQEESMVPLGHLAKAAGAAARQIGEGHEALLAEGPDRVAATLRGPLLQSGGPATTAATDTKQLLRLLARQIGADTEPTQEGHASETLRSIARQIGTADQLEPRATAEPGAGPIQRWLTEAKHLLRSTGDALDRAEEQVSSLAKAEPINAASAAPPAWVLTEILAAQAQIGRVYGTIGRARATARIGYRAAPPTLALGTLAGATTVLGMLLILATLWLVGGLWSLVAGAAALGGTALWVLRISKASRGLALDARS